MMMMTESPILRTLQEDTVGDLMIIKNLLKGPRPTPLS